MGIIVPPAGRQNDKRRMATNRNQTKKPAKTASEPADRAKPAKAGQSKSAAVHKELPVAKPVPVAKTAVAVAPKPNAALNGSGQAEGKNLVAATANVSESKAAPALKPVAKMPGAPTDAPQREDADSPLLDMSDAAVRKMVTRAKQRGYVTYDELNKVLPSDKVSSEQIEDTMWMLNEMGINVIESEEQDEQGDVPALAQTKQVT